MSGAYSVYGEDERRIQGFGGKTRGKELGVDGRIILRWIFRKWVVGVWTASICLRIETGVRHL
jgi:hypothetical protein